MSYSHLSVSNLQKVKKLMSIKEKALSRAARIQKRIKQIEKSYLRPKKREYRRRIKVISKKVNSANGRFDVKFESAVVSKLTGMGIQVLRFMPESLKRNLQYRGQWDDVAQTIYTSVIEFFRIKNGNLTTKISKSDYKKFMSLVNRNIYNTLSELLAGYGHRSREKYFSPNCLSWIPVSSTGQVPGYIHERQLINKDEKDSEE